MQFFILFVNLISDVAFFMATIREKEGNVKFLLIESNIKFE